MRNTITKGQTFKIERNYQFGKKGTEIVKVVGILNDYVLFDNGMQVHKLEIQ